MKKIEMWLTKQRVKNNLNDELKQFYSNIEEKLEYALRLKVNKMFDWYVRPTRKRVKLPKFNWPMYYKDDWKPTDYITDVNGATLTVNY